VEEVIIFSNLYMSAYDKIPVFTIADDVLL